MKIVISNLKEAINGESNAKHKYELFSEKAKEENLLEIALLFKAISIAEIVHIKNHLRALKVITNSDPKTDDFVHIDEENLNKNINDTKLNLIDAIKGETFETKKMYKIFVKNAVKLGNDVAELTFTLARKAEKIHAKVFSKYLKILEKDQIINNLEIYICEICGNVEFKNPSQNCSICDHGPQFFKKINP